MYEKEKMMVNSIFSFPHNTRLIPLSQGRLNEGLCGKKFIENSRLRALYNPTFIRYLLYKWT